MEVTKRRGDGPTKTDGMEETPEKRPDLFRTDEPLPPAEEAATRPDAKDAQASHAPAPEGQPPKTARARGPLACVTYTPPQCPRCRCLRLKVTKTATFPDREMALPDGQRHRGVRIQRTMCLDCGRVFNVKTPLT